MQYTLGVNEPYFSLIAAGKKTVEGRLFRSIFRKVRVGDIIIWKNRGKTATTKIVGLRRYTSFCCYLTHEGLPRTLPNVKTLADGVAVYRRFFTEKNEEANGVLAIELAAAVS